MKDAVELCFESHYWFDIRRWYIAHLPENKQIIDLNFDYDWTSFTRSLYITKVFEDPKHYWLPLPKDIVFLYKEMYQNAGMAVEFRSGYNNINNKKD